LAQEFGTVQSRPVSRARLSTRAGRLAQRHAEQHFHGQAGLDSSIAMDSFRPPLPVGAAAVVTDDRQATGVAIAADALNRMIELGRPEYVRIA
jgi:hypothetical protein